MTSMCSTTSTTPRSDFVQVDPRRHDREFVVARVVVSRSCILKLTHELEALQ